MLGCCSNMFGIFTWSGYVESGFSVNGSILVGNLLEESLVAQRQVYDALMKLEGLKSLSKGEIPVDRKMISYVQSSHKEYETALKKKEEGKLRSEKQKELKRKNDRINELRAKKAKINVEQNMAIMEIQMEFDALNAHKLMKQF